MKKQFNKIFAVILILAFVFPVSANDKVEVSVKLESRGAIYRAINFLIHNQEKNGSWHNHPGVTAFCLLALNKSKSGGKTVDDEIMKKGLAYLRAQVKADGSLKNSKRQTDIYSTSVCLMTLSKLRQKEDAERIKQMNDYLIKSQSNLSAFHYSSSTYPDLSNTHWALEAIFISAQDPESQKMRQFWHRSAKFISSCQITDEKQSDLGGFTYYPQGKKPAKKNEETPETVFGSLTMGALKTLLYAKVKADDPRMKNGLKWIEKNYSVDSNPGLKYGGYYYYLYMMSSLMLIWDKDFITVDNRKRNWRREILESLMAKQNSDGNWINKNKMWHEDNTSLCTAYAILSMEFCLVD